MCEIFSTIVINKYYDVEIENKNNARSFKLIIVGKFQNDNFNKL